MASVKAVVRRSRLSAKSGMCKVEISISHMGNRVYIDTGIECDPKEFSDGLLTKKVANHARLNCRIAEMVADWDESLNKIAAANLYDAKSLVELANCTNGKRVNKELTYSDWMKVVQKELEDEGRKKYAEMLDRSRKVLVDYLNERIKGNDIAIQDITPILIRNWRDWMLNKRNLSAATTGMYLAHVKALLNKAIDKGVVRYDEHPFAMVKIGRSKVRRCDIGVEELSRLRDANSQRKIKVNDKVLTAAESKVRDIWMMSFYCGGMNLKDMMAVHFDLENKCVEYSRIKTHGRNDDVIKIPLCFEARNILKKYIDDKGRLMLGYNGKHETVLRNVDKCLKSIGEKLDISGLCLYSARKSFGQLASEAGVNNDMIDYLLGHSNNSKGVIRHYVHEDFGLCAVAIRKVMDYVSNPKKTKADINAVLDRL